MSTDTPGGDTTATPPPSEAERRYHEAMAAAEEAKRRYEEAAAKATQQQAAAPTAKPDDATLAEIAALKQRLAALDTIEARAKKDAQDERIRHIRAMGLAVPMEDDDILRLAPDADPRTPEGRAKIEEWRTSRPPGFFKPKGPSAEAVLAQQQPRIDALRAKNTRLINPDVVYQRRARQ